MESTVVEYLKECPDLKWTDAHCGNCDSLENCLHWFAQPFSCPENADKSCRCFRYTARCKECGSQMLDRSKSDEGYTTVNYVCPIDSEHSGWIAPYEFFKEERDGE